MSGKNLADLYEASGYVATHKYVRSQSGPCPFCNAGTDRFTIFIGQGREGLGRYWCRQCGAHGDAIQFLRDIDGMSYVEALDYLGIRQDSTYRKCSFAPRQRYKKQIFSPTPAPIPSAAWQAKASAVVAYSEQQLWKSPDILRWLSNERGLTPKTIKSSRLGWMPKYCYRPYKAFGLPPEWGKNGRPRSVWIPKGLCIPVYSDDALVRVKFRLAEPVADMPRYFPLKQSAQDRNTSPLFLPSPTKNAPFIIVESELDAILLAQEAAPLVNVLALGSAQMRPDKATWERLLASPLVLVSLDFDDAGNKAACTWWKTNLPYGKYKLWPVPDGKDPTEAYKAGLDIVRWIDAGVTD